MIGDELDRVREACDRAVRGTRVQVEHVTIWRARPREIWIGLVGTKSAEIEMRLGVLINKTLGEAASGYAIAIDWSPA